MNSASMYLASLVSSTNRGLNHVDTRYRLPLNDRMLEIVRSTITVVLEAA